MFFPSSSSSSSSSSPSSSSPSSPSSSSSSSNVSKSIASYHPFSLEEVSVTQMGYQYIFARCHTMCPRRHHCVLAWSLQCCLWSLSCLWWIFRFLVGISITLRDVTNIVLNLYEWSLGVECRKLWSCADVPVFSRTNLWHLCVFAGHKGVEAKADVFFCFFLIPIGWISLLGV